MYNDPATQLQAQFSILRRVGATGSGYLPQFTRVRGVYSADLSGAQKALQDHLDHLEAVSDPGRQTGEYLVYCVHGAWTFEVKPPQPAPRVITAI